MPITSIMRAVPSEVIVDLASWRILLVVVEDFRLEVSSFFMWLIPEEEGMVYLHPTSFVEDSLGNPHNRWDWQRVTSSDEIEFLYRVEPLPRFNEWSISSPNHRKRRIYLYDTAENREFLLQLGNQLDSVEHSLSRYPCLPSKDIDEVKEVAVGAVQVNAADYPNGLSAGDIAANGLYLEYGSGGKLYLKQKEQ